VVAAQNIIYTVNNNIMIIMRRWETEKPEDTVIVKSALLVAMTLRSHKL